MMSTMPGNINSFVLLYGVIINIVGFACMYFDKRAARLNRYRISEKFLFTIAIIGAVIGVWIGMYMFRHKTKKLHFVFGMPIILIIQILILFKIK